MNRIFQYPLLLILLFVIPVAALPPEWKKYSNALVGISLKIQRNWQQVEVKETPQTGMVILNISRKPDPHVSLSIQRQKMDFPLEVYTSAEILDQLYDPGYRITPAEFAGRKSVKVDGTNKDDKRRQEAYYSAQPPFIDEIVFAAPAQEWESFVPTFNEIKQTLRWTR